jgi:hypothetical protein
MVLIHRLVPAACSRSRHPANTGMNALRKQRVPTPVESSHLCSSWMQHPAKIYMSTNVERDKNPVTVQLDRFLLFAPWDEYRAALKADKIPREKDLPKISTVDRTKKENAMLSSKPYEEYRTPVTSEKVTLESVSPQKSSVNETKKEIVFQSQSRIELFPGEIAVSVSSSKEEDTIPNVTPTKQHAIPMFDLSQSPVYHLNNYFRKIINSGAVPIENFSMISKQHDSYDEEGNLSHSKVWTAIFTCPKTRKSYTSGTLRDKTHTQVPIMDSGNRIFYAKLASAKHAVAARFLDEIQFVSTGLLEPRFCEEVPGQPQVQKPLNMFEVINYYKEVHGIDLQLEKAFISKSISIPSKPRQPDRTFWTSTFKCPVTGTEYSSSEPFGDDTIGTGIVSDNKIYYNKKNVSIFVAALRAVNALDFADNVQRSVNVVSKLIKEDSVQPQDAGDGKASLVQALFGPGPKALNSDHEVSTKADLPERWIKPTMQSGLTGFCQNSLPDETAPLFPTKCQEEEESDNYLVSKIPSVIASPPSERLLSIAAGPASFQNVTRASKSTIQSAIHAARAWLEINSIKHDKKQAEAGGIHRVVLSKEKSKSNLLVGKTLLASLAMANVCTPIGFKVGVEKIAENILDVLWQSENDMPDADAYALYIKCFDQETPKVAKSKAEQLVEDMKNGKLHGESGKVLPAPNQRVINALIQISAQVGGTSGRYSKHTGDDFRPDRDSFLSVLSSAIYPAAEELEVGGFDLEFTRECIKRMNELSGELSDRTLKPDTQVYNASLRWASAPKLWFDTRPYARCLPWDNYEALYSKGLRNGFEDEDVRFKQAQEMESWLDEMEKEGAVDANLSPTVESYEAVIQGWLRTVSRKGLERAEKVALRIMRQSKPDSSDISDPISPRVQTFHPLLAAWYHSGEPDASTKMLEWISRYESTKSETESLDSRIVEMRLLAYGMEQEKLLEDKRMTNCNEIFRHRMTTAAVSSSKALKDACSRLKNYPTIRPGDSQVLEVILFSLAAKSWKNAAAAFSEHGGTECYSLALSELFQLADLFDNYVRLVVGAETSTGISLKSDELSIPLAHLVSNAHQFYHILLGALIEVETGHQTTNIDSAGSRTRIVLLIEKMLRTIGELEEISQEFPEILSEKGAKKRLVHDDRFSYHTKPKDVSLLLPSRLAFLWQAIKYLEETTVEDLNKGDIIRLCLLIKNVDLARKTAGKVETAIGKIIERVLPEFNFEKGLNTKERGGYKTKRPLTKRGKKSHGDNEKHDGKAVKQVKQRRIQNVKSNKSTIKSKESTKIRKLSRACESSR